MTVEEAERCYTEPTNPRWVACHASLGERPSAHTFMCWLGPYWRRFAKLHGVHDSRDVRLKLGEQTDKLFNEWLKKTVNEEVRK